MYILKENLVTPHVCFELLSLLDSLGHDTFLIRHIWNEQGITDLWCARKCVEMINFNNYEIPIGTLDKEIIYIRKESI